MKNTSGNDSALVEEISALKQQIKKYEQSESDYKQREEDLKKNEHRFRSLSEASLEAIVFSENGIIVDANKALNRLFGYEGEELRGKPATDFIVPEKRPFTIEKMRTRTEGVYETLGLRKDNSMFPIEVNSREFENDGKQLRISAVRDLTERKQSEEALQESENRFRRLADNAQDLIYRMSLPDGKYEYVSPASYDITGFTPEECYNGSMNLQRIIHPDFAEYFNEQWNNLLQGEMPPFYEYKIIHKNGGERWLYQRNVLIRNENGLPATMEGIVTDITKRKLAEEALHESEERYRKLVENINKGIFVAQSGMLKYVNPMFMAILGHSKHDLTTLPFTEFIHPDDRNMVLECHMRRMKGEEFPTKYEFRILTSLGNTRWLELDSVMIQWEDKPAVLAFVGDITEQKQAEEELKKYRDHLEHLVEERTVQLKTSENKYRSIFENANDAILLTRQDILIDCNAKTLELFRCTREQIIGRILYEFSPPFQPDGSESRKKAIGKIDAAVSGSPQRFEWQYIRKDGTVFDTEISMHFVEVEGEKLIQAMVHDITERKRTEEAIKKAEEQYRSLVETVSESIWEADANGVITFVSPRIYNILGYKPEEVLGKRPFEFMSPEESKRTSAIFKKLVAEKKPIRSLEGTYIHKNGHTVLQEANGFPYFDKEGALLGYRGSDRDITEQKQILTELQQNKRDLENKSKTLEELNIALKVLLQQKTKDEEELEERFTSNASQLILPYIEKMKKSRLDERQQSYVTIMEANLNEIMSPFLHRVQQLNLAPREIQVANLIKNGKSTKEIAEIIGIAPASVNFYRKNIRDKLNLTNQKVNLQSYLQTFK